MKRDQVFPADTADRLVSTNRRVKGVRQHQETSLRREKAGRSCERGLSAEATERLLDVNDAAVLLSVAPRTLYKWAAQGRLPVVHLGRALRFRETTLRELIRGNEEPAVTSLASNPVLGCANGTDSALGIRP